MKNQNTATLLKGLRKTAGLTQESVAKAMGVSRPKYVAIEAGKTELSLSEIKKLSDLYQVSPSEIVEGELATEYDMDIISNHGSETRGNRNITPREIDPKVNPNKLRNVLLYILARVGAKPNVGETVLYKLLYFIDFDFYEKHGRSITGLSYIKNHYGPTPARAFSPVIQEMQDAGELEIVETAYFNLVQKKYLPVCQADISGLTAEEITHIDEVLFRLADKSAAELTELSHKDMPWLATKPNERIDYQLAMYRTDETSVGGYDDEL